jgi:hypothetical protein
MRDLEVLWRDPKNWKNRQYRCAQDPRLVVPKQTPWLGFTLNWAHPRATSFLMLTIAMVVVPIGVAVALWSAGVFGATPLVLPVAVATSVAATANYLIAKRFTRV